MASSSNAWHWITLLSLAAVSWISRGDPVLGPDLSSCSPSHPSSANETISCCLLDRPIVDFTFPPHAAAIRVRRAMHTLDEEYIRKYEKAYEIMRSLPDTDPRSFAAQYTLHCAYALSYAQFNSTDHLEIHHNYFNMPFHRWFVYFHEKILGSLLGDDTFGLPYWAWDVQEDTTPIANTYPSIFLDPNSSLFHSPRTSHLDYPRINLTCSAPSTSLDADEERMLNTHEMWRVQLGDTTVPESFYGYKDEVVISEGLAGEASGNLAWGPHKCVHDWVGGDMELGYSSAKDPIFFLHHSQIDRLWLLYQESGGPVINDRDWLDTEFLFYDENSDLVRVRIEDCLDLEKLRVRYEQVPAEWMDYVPPLAPQFLHHSSI